MNEKRRFSRLQFSLRALLILVTGVAIGLALAVAMLRLEPMPPSGAQRASLGPYVIESPDVLTVELLGDRPAAGAWVSGEHLVTPDGNITLGTFGQVAVAGKTPDEARRAIKGHLSKQMEAPEVAVEVVAYNSKVYYVIAEGGGRQAVARFPITGSDTVLDAVSQVNGPSVGSVRIVRPRRTSAAPETIPLDWAAVTRGGNASADFRILPGDRVYISWNR